MKNTHSQEDIKMAKKKEVVPIIINVGDPRSQNEGDEGRLSICYIQSETGRQDLLQGDGNKMDTYSRLQNNLSSGRDRTRR